MNTDIVMLAWGNLSHRRMRSWLTMIGIFIGIAAIVSLIGLGEGLKGAIISQFGYLGTDILSVQASGIGYSGPPGSGVITPLSDDLAAKIVRTNGVKTAFNRRIESVTMEFNEVQSIGFVTSVPSGKDRDTVYKLSNFEAESGRLLKEGDDKRVLLGNSFSQDDTFGKAVKAGDRIILNGQEYDVVGILRKKGSFIFDTVVFMNDEAVTELLGDDGTVDIITVQVSDVSRIDSIKESIERLLRRERGVKFGEEDFKVESPEASLDSLNSTLFAIQLFVYIIASISLVVGGIGIMNTMYTAVLERTREIGIMKAIGARNQDIFVIFVVESGLLGAAGGVVGILVGYGLAVGLAFLGRVVLGADIIQASITLPLVLGALLFSFLVGLFAGTLPAVQASRKNPVEAISYAV